MSLSQLVDSFLLNEQELRSKRLRSGKFSPSSFGRCFRNQYWNRKNEPESNPADMKSLRRMRVGTVLHGWLESLVSCQVLSIIERGYESIDCAYFVDVELEDKIVEIKTAGAYAFKKLCGKDYDIRKDKPHNILQAAYYAVMRKKDLFELYFFCTDSGLDKGFQFDTKDWVEKVAEELSILNGFWAKGKLPPPAKRLSWDCGYCNWKDKCEEEVKREV